MKPVISVQNMRESDADTIARLIPGKVLMYRAALGVFRLVDWKGNIAILTGSGNNGGDGYALAWILARHGIPCTLWRVSDKFSEDGRYFYELAVSAGVPERRFCAQDSLADADIVVDCMLGTGFSGEVRGLFADAIRAANCSDAYKVSVDINSGMNGDTGIASLAVKSDLTVAIAFLKTGLLIGDSAAYIGSFAIADIGIELLREEHVLCLQSELPYEGALEQGCRIFTADAYPREVIVRDALPTV